MTTHNQTTAPHADIESLSSIKGFVAFGLFVLMLFGGGAIYWAMTSRLDGAIVAPASFVVEGNRKTVEHLEGGIVRDILVKDGDFVDAGQTLVTLDSTDLDVDLTVITRQLAELQVRRARLLAQLSGQGVFTEQSVAAVATTEMSFDGLTAAFVAQEQLFNAALQARQTEADILAQQIAGLEQQIVGLEEQRASTQRQLEIGLTELENLETLQDKGLVAVSRVNEIKLEIERLKGADAGFRAQRTQAQNQISALHLTELSTAKQRDEAITTELAAVEAQLAFIAPQYRGAAERLERIAITAPVSGRVVGLSIFTSGGVVRPGTAILDIVPADETLVVEARVATADIEKLFVGQTTRIQLSAFDLGEVPEASGKIIDISADSFEDDRSGNAYYLTRVRLDAVQSAEVQALEMLPGMPADIFVNTGEKTALAYLTSPIKDRLARTFIE